MYVLPPLKTLAAFLDDYGASLITLNKRKTILDFTQEAHLTHPPFLFLTVKKKNCNKYFHVRSLHSDNLYKKISFFPFCFVFNQMTKMCSVGYIKHCHDMLVTLVLAVCAGVVVLLR